MYVFKKGYVRLPKELAMAVVWAKRTIEHKYEVDKVLREHTQSEQHYESVIRALETIAELREELGWWVEEGGKKDE